MSRRDWFLPLRLHLIKRSPAMGRERNYGLNLWGDGEQMTLDLFFLRTMWTLRRDDR